MRILAAVQTIFAIAFILPGLVALFGIGITGLVFLLPGAVFAATAAITEAQSRAAIAVALAADAVLAYLAARKLEALFTSGTTDITLHQTVFNYLPPSAALVLVAIGAVAVVMDWRALRNARWF
jgi:hypothetical protein